MPVEEIVYLTSPDQWRRWLHKNGGTSAGVWFTFCKKASGKPSLPYEDAIEEALCFGWIDSTLRRLGDDRYALQFTPRRNPKNWSIPNRRRLTKLIAEGRMTPAGLAVVDPAVMRAPMPAATKRGAAVAVPPDLRKALRLDAAASAGFDGWAPTYRRQYVDWVSTAKRPETRGKRIAAVVARAAAGKKFGEK